MSDCSFINNVYSASSTGVLVRKIQLYTALLYKGGADNAAIAVDIDIVFYSKHVSVKIQFLQENIELEI